MTPSTKASNITGGASGIDLPGLQGYQGLARLIYHDDGKTILKPGTGVDKQTEYLIKIIIIMARHFINQTVEDLEAGVKAGDCISMYHLGARLYAGARVKKNRPRALRLWTKVAQVDVPNGATITSSNPMASGYARIKANAYASLCAHHLRNYEKGKSMADLAQAFLCGEGAAKLGLVICVSNYTVLAYYRLQDGTPQRIEDDVKVDMRCKYTVKQADMPAHAAIAQCRMMMDSELWADFSAPLEETEPEMYACSRPGCTATTDVRSKLRRCAGLCDIANKPFYCTKQCQSEDWKRHRSQCSRPTDDDLILQFQSLTTNDKVDVDTSKLSSVDLARARQFSNLNLSVYDYLGGDNPSPVEKAFREFLQELDETACGGPRTGDQFMSMIRHMHKVFPASDLEMLMKPQDGKAPVIA